MRGLKWGAALVTGLTVIAGAASAQDIQNFEPAVGTWNYFSVEGASIAPEGALVPSLYVNYGHNPLARRDENDELIEAIVSDLTTFNVMGAYAFNEWLELGVDLPFSIVGGGDGLAGVGGGDGFALHDVRLIPKVNLLGGVDEMFGVAFALPISLPTGDVDKFAGDDTVAASPKFVGEVRLDRVRFAANLGFRYRHTNPKIETLELGNEVTYGAAVDVDVHNDTWHLLGEIYGVAPVEDVEDTGSVKPLEGMLGARYFTDWCGAFTAGAGMGIISDYGSPDYRVLGGFAWQCRDYDKDDDGIEDKDDACPEQAEDKDGFEDSDGCPELDNDKDGVLDADDKCVNDAEDKDDFEDSDGCPELDNDKDGVLDADDKCVNEAEDVDGFEDADGCPELDNDKDGVLDADDKCVNEAEDKDNFEDEDGCPDPDNDKDGFLDAVDNCPNDAEIINGVEDEDGCPDEGQSKVIITKTQIKILEKVYFASSKAKIKKRSFDVLDQVAAVLKAYTHIKKIRVEGHTDHTGGKKGNLKLSKARAASVRDYLIEKGVASERLEAEGYGSARPLVPIEQKGSKRKNRRVEFAIVAPEVKGVAPEVKGVAPEIKGVAPEVKGTAPKSE